MHAATHTHSFAPRAQKRGVQLPAGWWLLPAVVLGASFWVAAIAAVVA
jgi:hypothetical protein